MQMIRDDRFSAYDYQASLAGGLGYKLIDSERTKLWVQGGPGYRYAELQDTGEKQDGVIFRGDVGFDHQLTDTTKVVDRFLVEAGSSNTYFQNDLGLEVTITGALGLRVGYQVRHNTDVPGGVENTDTLTTVGLLYETKQALPAASRGRARGAPSRGPCPIWLESRDRLSPRRQPWLDPRTSCPRRASCSPTRRIS